MPTEEKAKTPAAVAPPNVADPSKDPATPPAPKLVTADEFAGTTNKLAESIAAINQNLTALATGLANRGPAPVAAPATPALVTDDELRAAAETGDPKAIRRLQAESESRILAAVSGAVNEVRTVGMSAIGALADRVVLKDLPHYDLLKSDIDKELTRLAPELRMNPEAIAAVGQMVAGRNIDKIVTARVEEELRKARGDADGNAGTGSTRETPEVTQHKELHARFAAVVGADAMQALKAKGTTPEAFVAKLGHYKDVEEYVKLAEGPAEGSA